MSNSEQTSTWLKFAQLQCVSESYLNDIKLNDPGMIQDQLVEGANNFRVAPKPADIHKWGMTQFTNKQANWVTDNFEIVDHYANDDSGFSCTLMREKSTGEYTLSFRSTEFKDKVDGGDSERDGLFAADGNIMSKGFAYGQLMRMNQYFRDLKQGITAVKTDGSVNTGKEVNEALQQFFANDGQVNVTGYSLGGHLANVFIDQHYSSVKQAYLFNAAGVGEIAKEGPYGGTYSANLHRKLVLVELITSSSSYEDLMNNVAVLSAKDKLYDFKFTQIERIDLSLLYGQNTTADPNNGGFKNEPDGFNTSAR